MLKKILLVLIFLFPINSIQADIKKIKFNGKIRYFSTLVNDYGVNYDDTRPGPVLDLHFTYPINEKLSVKSFNYIINYNDATSGCLLYTSPSPRDTRSSRMPSSA